MDFEKLKTIAAFGGLGLGLLNSGISLYKDFFRQGKVIVEIEKSDIKWRGVGTYDFLIIVNIRAIGKDVYLKDLWLEHPTEVFGPYSNSAKLRINKVTKHLVKNLLDYNEAEYETEVKEIFKSSEYVRDLCIKEGQQRTFTITDRFNSVRLSSEWLDVPLTQWKIFIDYGTSTMGMPFKFKNIQKSGSHAFCN